MFNPLSNKVMAEICKNAAVRLETKGWTQGANAKNLLGMAVATTDETAVCWCLYGAIRAEAAVHCNNDRDFTPLMARSVLLTVEKVCGISEAITWNDSPERTKEEVVDTLYRAAREINALR